MDKAYEAVKEFHKAFGHPIAQSPQFLPAERLGTRIAWITDELLELEGATQLVDQVDAIIDAMYFCLGTLVEMGVPPQAFFDLVQAANMAKLWEDGQPRFRDGDGKVIKPDGWEAPEGKIAKELERLLVQAGA